VDVDVRLVGRIIFGLCLVGLTVLTVILFVTGVHKNEQINRLRQQGVRVTTTVSGCQGLLGGSGSNAAGYSCTGTFRFDGHRYTVSIPGSALYRPGTKIRGVADPGDWGLFSTVSILATEHSSGRVFVLPTILLVLLVLMVVAALVLRRRSRRKEPAP